MNRSPSCHHNGDEVGHPFNTAAGCGQPPQPTGGEVELGIDEWLRFRSDLSAANAMLAAYVQAARTRLLDEVEHKVGELPTTRTRAWERGWESVAFNDVQAIIREARDSARCSTCGGQGSVPWMHESDPNLYQEPDADGNVPCPDCRGGAR